MKRTSWKIAVACCIAFSFSSADLFARGFAGGAGISKGGGGGGGGHPGGGGGGGVAHPGGGGGRPPGGGGAPRSPAGVPAARAPAGGGGHPGGGGGGGTAHLGGGGGRPAGGGGVPRAPAVGPAARAPAGGGAAHFPGGGGRAPAISRTPAFSHPSYSGRTAGGIPHAAGHPGMGNRPPMSTHAGQPAGVRQGGGTTFGGQHPGGGVRLGGGGVGAIAHPGAAAGAVRHFGGVNRAGITSRPYAGNALNYGNHSFNLAHNGYRPAFYGHGLYHGYWNGNYGFGGGYGGGGGGGYGPGWGYGRGWGYGPGYGLGLGIGYGLAPLGWGYGGWGLGSLAYNSGYLGYSNPYYDDSFGGYDYAQPIPVDFGESPTAAVAEDNSADAALNAAVAAFKENDYDMALNIINKGVAQYPTDSVMHEFRALVLFAMGDYRQAAATIHSVLAIGPGWDWTTLTSLYTNLLVYTGQLRALESYVRGNPQDGASRFLLGYHYMSAGQTDAAARQFQQVVELVPGDRVASELLNMISSPKSSQGAADVAQPTSQPDIETQPAANPAATPVDPTMLVGTWKAGREDGSKFSLTLTPENTFSWTFSSKQAPAQEFSGTYTVEVNVLALERKDGGSLIGEVTPDGATMFNFRLVGAPSEDKGLDFGR